MFRKTSPLDYTVIIPTRNRPDMLHRSLASVLNQRYQKYDIIVVDDASDIPILIDEKFSQSVTLLRSRKQLGAGGARNLGVMHATGSRVVFLDDDDEFDPNFLRATNDALQSSPHKQFSWCSAVLLHYNDDELPIRQSFTIFPKSYESEEELLAKAVSIGAGFGFTIDREVFQSLGGFDSTYSTIEDTEFFFRLISAGHRPLIVPQPLVRIHNHLGERLTAKASFSLRIQECRRLLSVYADTIQRYPSLLKYLQCTISHLDHASGL